MNISVTNLFAVLRLSYNDSLLTSKPQTPANVLDKTVTGTDQYKPLGATTYTNLYELFDVIEILAGAESIIKLSGTACRDFITECFADVNYDELSHVTNARPFITDDHRVIKIPWLSLFSITGINLLTYPKDHFKIILEYDVIKTGFNMGVKDKFPFIINETFIVMTGNELQNNNTSIEQLNRFSIKDFDIELNNSATSSQLEVNTLGTGYLMSLKLINKSNKFAYFEKIDLLQNNRSILPQLPLHVLNRSTQLSADGLYSRPNDVIANFDFRIYPYSSGYWGDMQNLIPLNPNDRFTLKLIPNKTTIELSSSIGARLVVAKIIKTE